MLGTNTHFTLAIHVLTVLALREKMQDTETPHATPSAALAESVETNPAFLRKQIGCLKKAGLLKTKLGAGGGTLLAKKPEEITLLDVYRLTEGQTELQSHHVREDSSCPVGSNIGEFFERLSQDLDAVISQRLAQTTIAELADDIFHQSHDG